MQVEVKLFASLSKYRDHPLITKEGMMELNPPAFVGHIVDALNIPPKEVNLIFINGVHGAMDSEIIAGDRVGLFPPIGGG